MRKITKNPESKFGIRHSPEMLRYASFLRNKLKDDAYTFNSKMLGLPAIGTINSYASKGASEPDGIVYSTLEQKRREFESKNKNLSRLD